MRDIIAPSPPIPYLTEVVRSVLSVVAAVWVVACSEPPELPPGQEGCAIAACHGRVEQAHYGGAALACVDCHGGNPDSIKKATAHPTVTVSFNPATPGVSGPDGRLLAGASLAELDDLDLDVLQFLNPADNRVISRTCGSTTRGGGNCH